MSDKPLIGIIGGAGPIASLDIENKIYKYAQQILKPTSDKCYPNLLIYQYTQFSETQNDMRAKQYIGCAAVLAKAKVD